MKKWYQEEYRFCIEVLQVAADNRPENCRNGHEVGDTYNCSYGCPEGLCSKSMLLLFPLMEAVRSGGDLANLLSGATKHSGSFLCPDAVVRFKLTAYRMGGN